MSFLSSGLVFLGSILFLLLLFWILWKIIQASGKDQ